MVVTGGGRRPLKARCSCAAGRHVARRSDRSAGQRSRGSPPACRNTPVQAASRQIMLGCCRCCSTRASCLKLSSSRLPSAAAVCITLTATGRPRHWPAAGQGKGVGCEGQGTGMQALASHCAASSTGQQVTGRQQRPHHATPRQTRRCRAAPSTQPPLLGQCHLHRCRSAPRRQRQRGCWRRRLPGTRLRP